MLRLARNSAMPTVLSMYASSASPKGSATTAASSRPRNCARQRSPSPSARRIRGHVEIHTAPAATSGKNPWYLVHMAAPQAAPASANARRPPRWKPCHSAHVASRKSSVKVTSVSGWRE